MNNETDNTISFRNRFLCRSCKKLYVNKEALDNHIILCYESRIDKMREEHKQEVSQMKKEYEEKIDEIVDYMTKHIQNIEQKHISLNNYLIGQIKTLSSL